VYSRTDHCFNISGQRTEPTAHFAHSFFHNALHRTAPTRMEHSHGSQLGVDEYDRQAVSRLDGEENAAYASDEAIAYQRFFRQLSHAVDEVGMDLAQGDKRPWLLTADGAELGQENRPVAFDCAARVLLGESQIEGLPAINAGKPAGSRAESMN